MKTLIMMAMMALTFIASAEYQVYDVKLVGKTTKAKGVTTTSCGDAYNYRDKTSKTILGVLAGCGCAASIADGTCQNALAVFWDKTEKKQIADNELTHKLLQRIAKNTDKVEQVFTLTLADGEWQCEVVCSGLGVYKADKSDAQLDVVKSINGHFAGWMSAPLKKGSCTACGSTPDEVTGAVKVCDCACENTETAGSTPYFGTYTIKYNSAKAKKCSKNGVSNANLGVPTYVTLPVAE